jgi:glycosyltransferase involved in cell wall biosynthesis
MYRWLTPATFIGKPRRFRLVHTYHGHVFHGYYGPARTRLFLMIEKLLARLATDCIIVITGQQRDEINGRFRVGRAGQFAVIPLGIDLNIYSNWKERRVLCRQELKAGADEILVGIVGRLTEIKNHKLFLQVAALLKKTTRGNVRFVIIGDGHLRRELEEQVDELGLRDDVQFLGSRQDPENFYPALDVIALTSLNEGTPLSLIEGMANARPVIATAVGGVVDLLGAQASAQTEQRFTLHERGLAVASGDTDAFAKGLDYLIANEPLRRELAERGQAFVNQSYAKERLLADMTALYADLLNIESAVQPETANADDETVQSDYRVRLTPRS